MAAVSASRAHRKPKKNANPLQRGIAEFLSSRNISYDLTEIPKKYTRYGSLLLVGPTFLHHSNGWHELLSSLSAEQRNEMFQHVLHQFPDNTITNVAMNAPISETVLTTGESGNQGCAKNVMRSPHSLQPLHGHFGPDTSSCEPSVDDFNAAYWAETIQLHGLAQVWAPRWTMFSRGNITEKARILQDGTKKSPFPGLTSDELGENLTNVDVLDFYVGIGYFAFCYLNRGAKRVWGWDINPWSIEGLRRGCIKNNHGVTVVKVAADGTTIPTVEDLVTQIERHEPTGSAVRCVAFLGDNSWASEVMHRVAEVMSCRKTGTKLNVRHCNLGLLPTSQPSWKNALSVLQSHVPGWLHVHENTSIDSTQDKAEEIINGLQTSLDTHSAAGRDMTCKHIEQVKTYAPGVMHCVFDIEIEPSLSS